MCGKMEGICEMQEETNMNDFPLIYWRVVRVRTLALFDWYVERAHAKLTSSYTDIEFKLCLYA